MSKRLSDDEKRVFTDRIQELEAKLARCRELAHSYIEAYEILVFDGAIEEVNDETE